MARFRPQPAPLVEALGTGERGIGRRVTTDSTTLLPGSVAFAAALPNGKACNPSGSSRVYGRDYGAAITTVERRDSAGNCIRESFFAFTGNAIDLHCLSVNGRGTLIMGIDTDVDGNSLTKIGIVLQPLLGTGRLNWRQLQVVE